VVEAQAEHAAVQAEQVVVGAEYQHRLGFAVRFTKRPRNLCVVDLPARRLGVARPHVAIAEQQAFCELGLDADLDFASTY